MIMINKNITTKHSDYVMIIINKNITTKYSDYVTIIINKIIATRSADRMFSSKQRNWEGLAQGR